jgi:hypothetical protein
MNIALHSGYESKTRATIKKLEMALESYKLKHGYYIQQSIAEVFYVDENTYDGTVLLPNFNEFIDYQKMKNEDMELYVGRYFILDGWGNPLRYQCPGAVNKTSFDFVSPGPDGKINTTATHAENADNVKNY